MMIFSCRDRSPFQISIINVLFVPCVPHQAERQTNPSQMSLGREAGDGQNGVIIGLVRQVRHELPVGENAPLFDLPHVFAAGAFTGLARDLRAAIRAYIHSLGTHFLDLFAAATLTIHHSFCVALAGCAVLRFRLSGFSLTSRLLQRADF